MLDLDQVLADAVSRGASDVHIKVGSPPHMRLDGELVHASEEIVQAADTERVAFAIMPKVRAEEFISTNEADFATLVKQMRAANITVSTVAVGQGSDKPRMLNIAQQGGGKFYSVDNPRSIPRIFVNEARRVARPVVYENDKGFSDAAHFSRRFRKAYGCSPVQYRGSSRTRS